MLENINSSNKSMVYFDKKINGIVFVKKQTRLL